MHLFFAYPTRLQTYLFFPLFFPLFLLHSSPLLAQVQQFTITGSVLDSETDEKLAGAHVFIANTLLGTTTDAGGAFTFTGIPAGTHVFAVSMLGYEPYSQEIRLTEQDDLNLVIRLTAQIYEANEIEVVAAGMTRREERRRNANLKRFKDYFLGVSAFARQCEILNPEVLTFTHKPQNGFFTATAIDALIIENKALGYELRFILEEFEVQDMGRQQQIKYSGKTGFRELTPQTRRQERRWRRNRERAYRGSQNHFLAALINNRLWQEGYLLLEEDERPSDYSGIPGARPSNRIINVSPEDIVREGTLPSERILEFDGFLKVINTNEYSEEQYLKFKDRVNGWKLAEDEDQQTSWLALTQGPVTVTADGRVNESYGITKLGYWFFERVAEMLPIEYTPTGSELFTDAKTAPPVAAPVLPPPFDVAREDRFIARTVQSLGASTNTNAMERLSTSYLEILERADTTRSEPARTIIQKHLAQMFFLLPDSLQEQYLASSYQQGGPLPALAPGAGRQVAAWWRAQDPLPATNMNERIVEHLARVNYAATSFPDPASSAGFDDRGYIYVRYGSPSTRETVQTDLPESRQVLQQAALPASGPMEAPANEYWGYRPIDDRLQFVFVQREGLYRIGSAEELIPDELRSVSKRGDDAYARALIAAYRSIYSDLARYHPMYEEQLQELEFYAAELRANSQNADADDRDFTTNAGSSIAASRIQGMTNQFTTLADRASIERDEQAPRQASSYRDQLAPLSVALHASRFRDTTGQTLLELNWSHEPGTLSLPSTVREERDLTDTLSTLINVTVVQHDSLYNRIANAQLTYIVSNLEQDTSFAVTLTDSLAHVSLQWSQHRHKQHENGDVDVLERLKVGTYQLSDLSSLSAEAGVLEMSDPKPVHLGENTTYPSTTVTSQTPLGLYIEVYELALDNNGQARFTVEYEINRDARRRRDRKTTAATDTYTTDSSTAREYIALDLSEFTSEGPIDVELRVIDEVSGQEIGRRLMFTVTPAP